ncbi:MAG: ABC transporter ATP-binding protein [Opitutus sp.]|nr:ABC transporter ATP-binding protein [Opitutus sp.]
MSAHHHRNPMLEVTSVTKRYGTITALDGISLHIPRGEFFGLLGPNGAGKSTLMSLVAGLRAPDAGGIRVDGVSREAGGGAAVHALGFAPQSIALYEELTAEENLGVFGRLCGLAGSALRARIDECLAAVQLNDRRKHPVKTYSGGMQRRLNLAAALLHSPKLLLCDEPTVGVDPQSRNAIFDLLQRLNREGLTVIYSTHYMEEATRLCSRIGIIDHGRILALGSLDQLIARLPSTEVVTFARNGAASAAVAALAWFGTLREQADSCELHLAPGVRLAEFFAAAQSAGFPDRAFQLKRPTLEDLFLHLTGKTLRE